LSAVVLYCMSAFAAFELHTLPYASEEATCFAASVVGDGSVGLFVLDGSTLAYYADGRTATVVPIALPADTVALDIADTSGDGTAEVIALGRDAVYRIEFAGRERPTRTQLFAVDHARTTATGGPVPRVLVTPFEDAPAIALSRRDALVLYRLDCAVAAEFPAAVDPTPTGVLRMPAFDSIAVTPPILGGPGALEYRVTHAADFVPDVPDEAVPLASRRAHIRARGARGAATEGDAPERWPWFPLRMAGDRDVIDRAYFAATDGARPRTAVHVRWREGGPEADDGAVVLGPRRRYPGRPIVVADTPDFNGDGFADLLLWTAPTPALTVQGLARALTQANWPVRLRAHVYMPDKRRFAPQAAAGLDVRGPVAWYLRRPGYAPLKQIVLRDMNGDGRTDIGVSTGPRRYAVWLYGEDGFASSPAASHTFSSNILGIAMRLDLDGTGRTSIVLRTAQAFYVIRAAAP